MSWNCTLFHGDDQKCDVIVGLKRGFGSLSLIGCVFMVVSIWLFRKYQVRSQRLILYLTIAAFFDTIGYMMGKLTEDGPQCDFEAWWMTYFDWTVLAWTSCITFDLYMLLTRGTIIKHWKYHIICWIVPFIISLLPFIGDNYGPAGAWCWIKHSSPAWRFAIWYIPLFVIIIAMLILWSRTIYLHKRNTPLPGGHNANSEMMRTLIEEDMKTLRWYPLVYLLLSIFPLILRIHNAFTDEGEDVYFLWIMTAITAPLQGACNAVVFGLDPDTRSKLSWFQVKMAFTDRFSSKQIIQEYPVNADVIPDVDEDDRTRTSTGGSENVPYGAFDYPVKTE